jgi:hypothetical protein
MNDQKKETTISNEAGLSDTDLDKVAGGSKNVEHATKPQPKPAPPLPYALPGNATLKDWLE